MFLNVHRSPNHVSKLALCFFLLAASTFAIPVHLRTNALNTPIGFDTPKPTFSWMSDATTPNWTQSAYEILVDPEAENLRPGHAASQIRSSGWFPPALQMGRLPVMLSIMIPNVDFERAIAQWKIRQARG